MHTCEQSGDPNYVEAKQWLESFDFLFFSFLIKGFDFLDCDVKVCPLPKKFLRIFLACCDHNLENPSYIQ